MGAVSGEGLMKQEKMHGPGGNEEKILVLVRLRPLNEKEIAGNEAADWECINNNAIIYRNSLREGSTFPSSYSFDRVFRGDCTTRQVYDDGVKEIALSVINGINSSIFAYGQTSSGKTYTMSGITEYAVTEIFDYIRKHEERAYVLKFSAIEIYNEAIRDLLTTDSNASLRLRDDPERGVIVDKVTEESLRDWSHFKELLSICEAQRRIGETSLNEKSSRSHQILKLTIESSAREFLGKDNSTTLSASVNFVDLAGSERASQASSAGSRLKEGCHINRSLLTLGTVIRKLSKGRNGHINYRDSKLTRILQPALGGNARTAIICTLSPSRSHVEQTRNTLLFACCAKEVTTKAQVNIVMSDKALVKHLQRELARLESELRTPIPASSSCNCAASLRKKDIQIEKMEKEIRGLTKQRDLAESRINDLLQMIGNDPDSRQARDSSHSKQQATDLWDDEGLMSEESSVIDTNYGRASGRKYDNHHYYDREEHHNKLQESIESNSLSEITSSPLSTGKKSVRSNSRQTLEQPEEYCKEVQCVETDDSQMENNHEPFVLSNGENEETSAITMSRDVADIVSSPVNVDSGISRIENGFTYGALQQNLQDVQKTIDSLVSPHHMDPYAKGMEFERYTSKNTKFIRSSSCRENLMIGSSSPDREDQSERTPPNGLERKFSGRPESVRTRLPPLNYDAKSAKLLRSDSQSSTESASSHSMKNPGDDMTSIHTFISGLKKAKLQYENQLTNGQGEDTSTDEFEKNVRDVGLDPVQEASGAPLDWPLEFERQQRAILELWQICNVSLVHRTYFFLLFKGDHADSIYVEVELRRLSFLKETFSQGTRAKEGGQFLTAASSARALRREREMLSKLMNRRLSEEERNRLYEKWGIALRSKRRRMQLANLIWSNSKDLNHVNESASVVAKLIRFTEGGQALKEMFGLSFTPPSLNRRSLTWKRSMASLS